MTTVFYTPATTVGEIVAARPQLARIFERVGIDYCCGGWRSLTEACAPRQLDPATFAVLLEAAAELHPGPTVDVSTLSLTALADHIEATHHAYLRADLPRLVEQSERVAGKHGSRDPRLPQVAQTLRALAGEMFLHLMKEEEILFPLVRDLDAGRADLARHGGSIAHPIRQMEHEHGHAGAALDTLRTLTDGFQPEVLACNTHRALLAGLARLEHDLLEHMHVEDKVLFPRALALEHRAGGQAQRQS